MRTYKTLFIAVVTSLVILIITANLLFINNVKEGQREYRVQIERVYNVLKESGIEAVDLTSYPLIIKIVQSDLMDKAFFEGENEDYVIKEANGVYYRIEYEKQTIDSWKHIIFTANKGFAIMALLVIGVLIFVGKKVINPFNKLREVPYELSKGNLTVPLEEDSNKYFGHFVWGLNMLREKLEQQKAEGLRLHKDEKTLILSISHDIKTPLSAIKLYSKALSKNLYSDKEKQLEAAESINDKADEIERFIAQIIKASNEDFLELNVEKGEFYLSELMDKISRYYDDKLKLLNIAFDIKVDKDHIFKGDIERAVEVLQNVIENAIKYGDGQYIKIELSEEEDCCLVSVINGGCRLTDSELNHIFDVFWRGSNIGNASGSGLGLYICRQLMNKMDGEIFSHCEDEVMTVTIVFRKA